MSKSLNNLDNTASSQDATIANSKPKRKSFLQSLFNFGPRTSPLPEKNRYAQYENSKARHSSKKVLNTIFLVDERYEILDVIGQGAYGVVVSAADKQAKSEETLQVAIKKIEKAFEHKLFTKRTLRELKILRLLKHENIIGINTIFLPRSREDFTDIYVCSPIMQSDLDSVIKSSQPISDDHIKFFIYQILRGLKYMHSAGIIHRDIKPRNLLVNTNCDLKICDFGLSRTLHCLQNQPGEMTDYVVTRWYRAPELLMGSGVYGPAVDVWSVGCILVELIRRKPLLAGADTTSQLDVIFKVFGTPTEEYINTVPRLKMRKYLQSLPPRKGKNLDLIFAEETNPLAIDLFAKMMELDSRKRITVEQALKHPYLKELHCPEDEPVRELIPSVEFEFERYILSLEQYKDLIYEEILLYHFEDFRKEYFRRIAAGENPNKEVINNLCALKKGKKVDSDDEE